ncbi:MAG: phytanoyl-CoA dioxygenase family protein [Granulosicoccus sp.]|nr:phytanoyl-CoA dioxygenase family protein [Granulosicoccus sp.]
MLTLDQLRNFEAEGYLVVEDVFDDDILSALRIEYEAKLRQLCAEWVDENRLSPHLPMATFEECVLGVYDAGLDYFQPLDISLPPGDIKADTPTHFGDAVFAMMTYPRLLDLVESIIGAEIESNPIQHVRIKPPSAKLYDDEIRAHITATDWHQDRAVTLEEADATRMVTVWVAVNDATVENGCLQVIPGSHRQPMQPHCPQGQLAIPIQCMDLKKARPLPVKAGGIVMFDPLTIHSSLTNRSKGVRWSFDLRYNVTGDPTGRPMFPGFVARSRTNPETVLRDPEKWRALWRTAQDRLVHAPAVEIHRWPADAEICA